jgi:hypothetical protein
MTPLAPDILDCLPEDLKNWVIRQAEKELTTPVVILRQLVRDVAEYPHEREDA